MKLFVDPNEPIYPDNDTEFYDDENEEDETEENYPNPLV